MAPENSIASRDNLEALTRANSQLIIIRDEMVDSGLYADPSKLSDWAISNYPHIRDISPELPIKPIMFSMIIFDKIATLENGEVLAEKFVKYAKGLGIKALPQFSISSNRLKASSCLSLFIEESLVSKE